MDKALDYLIAQDMIERIQKKNKSLKTQDATLSLVESYKNYDISKVELTSSLHMLYQ